MIPYIETGVTLESEESGGRREREGVRRYGAKTRGKEGGRRKSGIKTAYPQRIVDCIENNDSIDLS